jgi:hypothetical protein
MTSAGVAQAPKEAAIINIFRYLDISKIGLKTLISSYAKEILLSINFLETEWYFGLCSRHRGHLWKKYKSVWNLLPTPTLSNLL